MNDNGFDPNSEKDPWEYGDRQQDGTEQEPAPQDAAEPGSAEGGEPSSPEAPKEEQEPQQEEPAKEESSGQSAPPQRENPPEQEQTPGQQGQAPGQPPYPPYGQGQYGTPPYGGNGYGPYGAPYGSPYGTPPYGQQNYGNYGGYGNQNGGRPGGSPYDNPYGQPYWNYSANGQYRQQPNQPPMPPKKMNTGLKALLWVLGVLVVGLIAGTAVYGYRISNQNLASASSGSSASSSVSGGQNNASSSASSGSLIGGVEGDGTNPDSDGITVQSHPTGSELTATEVYKRIIQSVVGVQTTISGTQSQQSGTSEGTGIIASSDGYILTNAHVIDYSKSYPVKVILHNNKSYEAKVVGYDKTSDLAVLKINATGLSAATFGTVDGMQVGDQVIAIGNPGGMSFAGSLTGGYISALDRSIEGNSDNGMTYIQTDAAINPGNSGGPLLNLYGQVVGINSNKIVATGYEGMGFAIPVSRAKTIIDDLIVHGYVSGRTRLGIKAKTVEEIYTQLYGYPQGVLIVGIDSDSSLKNSGAVQGDIITEADGTKITDMDGLYAVLNRHKPGDTIKMKIYSTSLSETAGGGKAGATKEISVKLLEDKGETQ